MEVSIFFKIRITSYNVCYTKLLRTESYSDIIDRIVTRAELKVTKDQIINTAEEKYKSAYKTPGKSPIAIDGWIKLLLIHFIALFLSSIIQLTGITANNYSDNATIKPLFT